MIKSIYIAPLAGGKTQSVQSIQVVAGAGIVGDRYYNQSKWSGQNITFIASEAIEAYNRDFQQSIGESDFRRNVVTTGVDLNTLVGKVFSIGGVMMKGVELCEPCKDLGDQLSNDKMSSAEVVKAFLHRGGLRADVCSDGELTVGMSLIIES